MMNRHTGRFRVGAQVALIALLYLMAACSSGGASNPDQIEHPSGDALVLRVATEGGFLPADAAIGQIPGFSMFGDGRVIVTGAVPAIFPGPAMPPLQVRTLSERGLQTILRTVAQTGLFTQSRELNGAAQFVADAPTTVFTLHADGREVTISVYALGMFGDQARSSVPAAEVDAHRALMSLSERLTTLDLPADAWTDAGWSAYAPAAMRLFVRNADADAPDPSGIPNQFTAWPIEADAASFGEPSVQQLRCGIVTGGDADAWLGALSRANQLTRFTSNGHNYVVQPRPLLPDERHTCPRAAA